ncbi:S26 family signal peptidase [Rhizomonospora bruguierae]|uniref:S26 family signal peptidase n=1 Tax=Rhizomonospora bruguierae TaxID=1581705 RepID=UPI001BCDD1F8|nr:S26 family signal peptidase [Micromonospora sp. NBRC 107566]
MFVYAVLLAATAVVALSWLARRLLVVVTVDGHSMAPQYLPGDRLLALRRAGRAGTGDVVVFAWLRAGVGPLVKRVAAMPGEPVPQPARDACGSTPVPSGHAVVIGDGPGSVDSREWGLLPLDRITAVVVIRLGGPTDPR